MDHHSDCVFAMLDMFYGTRDSWRDDAVPPAMDAQLADPAYVAYQLIAEVEKWGGRAAGQAVYDRWCAVGFQLCAAAVVAMLPVAAQAQSISGTRLEVVMRDQAVSRMSFDNWNRCRLQLPNCLPTDEAKEQLRHYRDTLNDAILALTPKEKQCLLRVSWSPDLAAPEDCVAESTAAGAKGAVVMAENYYDMLLILKPSR